jgi:hypothetical protein
MNNPDTGKNPLPSSLPTEVTFAFLAEVPTVLLEDEITRRNQAIMPSGEIAARPEVHIKDKLEYELDALLDEDLIIFARDQLGIMRDFWSRLGFRTPDLSDEQQHRLMLQLVINTRK